MSATAPFRLQLWCVRIGQRCQNRFVQVLRRQEFARVRQVKVEGIVAENKPDIEFLKSGRMRRFSCHWREGSRAAVQAQG